VRKLLIALAAVLGLVVGTTAPAGAITGNFQKDFEHTYVGLIAFYDENGEFLHRCTGSALNEWTVLTAGHCTDGATSARIWFLQDVGSHFDPATELDPTTGYPDYCAAAVADLCRTSHELYNYGFNDFAGFPNTHDVGLVILDEPIQLDQYASIAAPGTLDQLSTRRGLQDLTFTLSGYGVSREKPFVVSYRERLMATTKLISLNSAQTAGFNIQTTTNPGGGKGGSCFGDSGGPILYDATDIIVAVNSFVLNGQCAGTSFGYRVDTQAVVDWILAHAKGDISIVPLPIG
jgi:hypothetical protein